MEVEEQVPLSSKIYQINYQNSKNMQNLIVFLFIYFLGFLNINEAPAPMSNCVPLNSESIANKEFIHSKAFVTDTALAYSSPSILLSPTGQKILLWSEKSMDGITSLCYAIESNNDGNFSTKKIIAQNTGIGNSKFSKAKLLFRKNGDWVAVYSQRFENPPVGKPGGRGPAGIVFSVSKDKGTNWSDPIFVDTDPDKKLLRGFFDASIMPNDELAVAYLKDVAGSTKHEERNIRLVTTKNLVPQAEQIIDPVACDCCPVNMSITSTGELQIMYRDNNDDIRDMAILSSKDDGKTFAPSRILSPDNWKIAGCPHSGATVFHDNKASLWAWQAGSEKEPGLRLVNANGKKLFLNSDASAKNPVIGGNANTQVLAWEQTKDGNSQIAYKLIQGSKISDVKWLPGSENATGVSAYFSGKDLYFTYEVKMANKKNQLKVEVVKI